MEVFGGVDLDMVGDIVCCGVDVIFVGVFIYFVCVFDFGFDLWID